MIQMDILDTKQKKNLIKTLLNRTLERALDPPPPPPPSTSRTSISPNRPTTNWSKFAENLMTGLGGGAQAKSSWLSIY